MKFCVISPLNHLDLMLKGDYIFGLAHLYVKDQKYRDFLHQCKKDDRFIIMDNSMVENSPVTEDVLIDICKELMPDEIIAPDVLFNKNQTLSNLYSFIERILKEDLLGKIKIMGVPQGNNQYEWISCYKEMINNSFVNTIGWSKGACAWCFVGVKNDQGIMEGRHLVFDYLKDEKLLIKFIHLLGAGDPHEFSYYQKHPMIRSNDTCNWIWSAMNNILFERNEFQRIKTPFDYFERNMSLIEENQSILNIKWVKDSIK